MRQNATVLLPLLAGLLLALTGAPAARAQGDLALLREHAPRLHHDARDPAARRRSRRWWTGRSAGRRSRCARA